LAGLVLGFVELPGDWFAWRFGGLRYPGDTPLLASPLYMPFAYVPAVLQFGYIAWWAAQHWSLPKAGVVLAVVGGSTMPLYETVAKAAKFWSYEGVNMIFGTTPLYIILAEVLLAAALPFALHRLHRQSLGQALLVGGLVGIWFDATGPLSLTITDWGWWEP
jgi:hypothetical protein